jgi:hypothetical protein
LTWSGDLVSIGALFALRLIDLSPGVASYPPKLAQQQAIADHVAGNAVISDHRLGVGCFTFRAIAGGRPINEISGISGFALPAKWPLEAMGLQGLVGRSPSLS